MPKKKEKIIEQVFKADLVNGDKQLPLLKDLAFLKNIKFHSVVRCESKDKERPGRRIVLLPRHMKELLNSFNEKLSEEQSLFDKKLNSCARERRKLKRELNKYKQEHEKLNKVNEQLMKNIEDKSLDERNRPKYPSGYSSVFDDAAPQLHGLPVQGGAPS
jgi:septal ring factor EnvC (AmiA/AmiB activator)